MTNPTTNQVDDGGPTFPAGYHPEGNSADQFNMSLREWLVGQALMGSAFRVGGTSQDYKTLAIRACKIADHAIEVMKKGYR